MIMRFVDIRGVHDHGGPPEVGEGHQAVFDSMYKGSVIRCGHEG